MAVQLSLNHPETQAITLAIGRLIVNFGYVEYETYIWLACLKDSLIGLEDSGLFKSRVSQLLKALAQTSHSLNSQATNAWDEALEIAKFRNRIAHNAIFFGWLNPDEKGAPDFLAVLDAKVGLNSGGDDARVTFEEINKYVNQTAKLGQRLRELRGIIWSD